MTTAIRRFNRYELKYVLPAWKCEAIIADLDRLIVEPPLTQLLFRQSGHLRHVMQATHERSCRQSPQR